MQFFSPAGTEVTIEPTADGAYELTIAGPADPGEEGHERPARV